MKSYFMPMRASAATDLLALHREERDRVMRTCDREPRRSERKRRQPMESPRRAQLQRFLGGTVDSGMHEANGGDEI